MSGQAGALTELDGDDIVVVTPEMVAAGTTVLLEADYSIESESDVVRDILFAAISVNINRRKLT